MFLPHSHSQSWRLPSQMRKSWEFASGTKIYIGTAIFAPHERSLHLANMTAVLIAAGIAARTEAMIVSSSLNATIAEKQPRVVPNLIVGGAVVAP